MEGSPEGIACQYYRLVQLSSRWFIVVATFLIALVTVGARRAFGVFVIPMSGEFGWNRSTISLVAVSGFVMNGMSQPLLGQLFDTFGGRKGILVSLAIFGGTTLLLALTCNMVFFIVLFGLLMSIASSGTSLTITGALLSWWFHHRRTNVLNLSTAGASAGGLLLVPLAMYVLQHTHWRLTWVALGAIILVVAWALAYVFLRNDPTDLRLLPDGEVRPADGRATHPGHAVPGPLETGTWPIALRSLPFWQVTGSYFVCGFTTAILTAHFISLAIDWGLTPSTAATALGVMNGLNMVGVLAVGALADRGGQKDLLALVYAVRGRAYALFLLAPGAWSLWGVAAVTGFSYWATAPLSTALTADIYGLKTLGTLSGAAFLVHQVGAAASIQFAGLMRDLTGSYTLPFRIAGLLLLPAALSAFSIREKQFSTREWNRLASARAGATAS